MLINELRSFEALFLDVICRYWPQFLTHQAEYAAMIPRMLVGWMHLNAGHNLSCQLTHCGMYYDGLVHRRAARAVLGE